MKDGRSLENEGVAPDEVSLPLGRDLREGRDPVLSRAASLLGLEISPSSAHRLFLSVENRKDAKPLR
jgi:C-terminal processing protease CtpA/Prc